MIPRYSAVPFVIFVFETNNGRGNIIRFYIIFETATNTKTKRLGRSLVRLWSDALSTLSQESSGPFSPLGVRVGARVEGLV